MGESLTKPRPTRFHRRHAVDTTPLPGSPPAQGRRGWVNAAALHNLSAHQNPNKKFNTFSALSVALSRCSPRGALSIAAGPGGVRHGCGGAADAPFRGGPGWREAQGTRSRRRTGATPGSFFPLFLWRDKERRSARANSRPKNQPQPMRVSATTSPRQINPYANHRLRRR